MSFFSLILSPSQSSISFLASQIQFLIPGIKPAEALSEPPARSLSARGTVEVAWRTHGAKRCGPKLESLPNPCHNKSAHLGTECLRRDEEGLLELSP